MPLKRQLIARTLAFAVMVFGLAASADYTLERDETWMAADVATKMTGVINLNGHTLTVPELKGNATITDSTDTPGELHVNVAEGTTENTTVALSGSLKLVKEGAGTFVASKSGQTYAGGTEVTAGTFRVAASSEKTNNYVGTANGAVTVGAGATLDVNGNPDFTSHPITLAGGTLKNGSTTNSRTQVGAVTLAANSTVSAGYGITHAANVVLDGNTLTVKDLNKGEQSYYRMSTGISYVGPGAVSVSGGFFQFDGATARDMSGVDLVLGSAVNLSGNITVRNLESLYSGGSGTKGTAGKKFLVTGTYTASKFHRACEMQNGSTLDLSALTGPVSNVTFAAGATVSVALGARTDVGDGERIVAWTAKPDATVTFRTVGEKWESMDLTVENDGLHLRLGESAVANAVWTGKGDDPTDMTDPANWQCTNARGAVLEGKTPTGDTVVTLPDGCANSFPVDGAFEAREVVLPATLGADNLDWSGITAPFSGTLDLQGKTLTLSQLKGTATITDSTDTPGELHVNVAEGTTENTTVALSGSLKLVKEGAGTFVAAKSGQTYAGGTEVAAGTFQVAASSEKTNSYVGAANGAVTVGAGATLDVNGNPDFTTHPITLAGGTLKNGSTTKAVSVGAVTLTADSAITVGGGITHTANVALGGNTLTMTTGGAYFCKLESGVSYTGSGVVFSSGGILQFVGTAVRDMSNVDLTIVCAVYISGNITVRNLESRYTGRTASGNGKFLVTGAYKPAASFHRACEMQNGSTLDLSALTGPVSNVTFAADSTVSVALGERTDVGIGDRIVAWTAKPDATMTLLTVGEKWESMDLKVEDDGLCLAAPYVANAVWTGKGDDPTDMTDPANWRCTNIRGVILEDKTPTGDTVVTLPDGCTSSFPTGFTAKEVVLPATLGADNLDWSGITAPLSGTLDLKGKTLTLSQLTGNATITDTTDTPGELHVNVAEGTMENTTVTLTGSLKLVKDGAGTFVAAKSGQTYAGGTEVAAGTFRVAASSEKTNSYVGAANGAVTVGAGATLDVNGNPDFTTHPIVLAGGTLKNGVTTKAVSVGAVTLTADSAITVGGGITHTANVALGGNTLTMTTVGAYYCNLAAGVSYTGSGAVSVSGGYFQFIGGAARDMGEIDLTIASAVLLYGNITVRNLESLYTGASGSPGTSAYKFRITGAYKPTTKFHRGCEMQNGSTLDLSALTGPVSNVTFAANSTVAVSLGGRKARNEKLVSWEATAQPADTVKFVGDPALNARLVRKSEGLWLQTGFLIRIR